ncbi:hypothetical protein [Leptolyngbya ohadii]|uniref:hypothetical protein n=1 Tax=Leptolyngbya ohadii TaxID=1962290 RepID=UPI00117AC385|nr:hypothetical protein [Leptolyngbya ohadii]
MGAKFVAKRRSRHRKTNSRHRHPARWGTETGAAAGMPMFLQRSPVANNKTGDRSEQEFDQVGDRMSPEAVAQNSPSDGATEPLPAISGEGETYEMVAFANTLTLRGRTDASFSNSFTVQNGTTTHATGCENCPSDECVRVRGTLRSVFNVTTTVTLPQVSNYPDLTPCQRQRVQAAITNVLAPHEQQHVAAFQTYRGTVLTPFNLTLCRADIDSTIQSMHDHIEQNRRSSAQSASDALDPFNFDVDLDCSS